uniref:Uncharacterized protein n=1 Tax=Arundo donax TaxID=35708 RepID=A0A0A9F6M2_ARUDO
MDKQYIPMRKCTRSNSTRKRRRRASGRSAAAQLSEARFRPATSQKFLASSPTALTAAGEVWQHCSRQVASCLTGACGRRRGPWTAASAAAPRAPPARARAGRRTGAA